ncbi:hypothetical protein PPERSA_09576 [Pseudocohnilembus persalinus]|uniref:Transmembrane protein n=1 Tax=Pseudocohnilembus persalinus TaxID=266149 RepID=A0A0V0QFL5_PSEPJ|nr:hypothetical protein PPERSA_09576 [Pseudocohnilembus persalinus]|eukprot:KRX00970.1 hypothetical protein PPERSA_09576 [Pseudocohnilembus persalinus]
MEKAQNLIQIYFEIDQNNQSPFNGKKIEGFNLNDLESMTKEQLDQFQKQLEYEQLVPFGECLYEANAQIFNKQKAQKKVCHNIYLCEKKNKYKQNYVINYLLKQISECNQCENYSDIQISYGIELDQINEFEKQLINQQNDVLGEKFMNYDAHMEKKQKKVFDENQQFKNEEEYKNFIQKGQIYIFLFWIFILGLGLLFINRKSEKEKIN